MQQIACSMRGGSFCTRTALHLHFCGLCAPNDISNAALLTACEALAKNHGGHKKFSKKIDLKSTFCWVFLISSPTKPCPATSKDRGRQWNVATSMLAKLQVLEQSEVDVLSKVTVIQKDSDSIATASLQYSPVHPGFLNVSSLECVYIDGLVQGYGLLGGHEFQFCWVAEESFMDSRERNNMSCWESPSIQVMQL